MIKVKNNFKLTPADTHHTSRLRVTVKKCGPMSISDVNIAVVADVIFQSNNRCHMTKQIYDQVPPETNSNKMDINRLLTSAKFYLLD